MIPSGPVVLVGLTGGIGSGKSTVSAALAERGAEVIDADEIVRSLQQPGEPVFDAIVDLFGSDVVTGDGSLDRQAVARLVFADGDMLKALNGVVHPAVGSEIARRLEVASMGAGIVILDVPLLVESGRDDMAALIVVDLDAEEAIRRLVGQRGFTEADARARMARQASREDRLARADFVIDNAGDRSALDAQVDRCWDWIRSLPDPDGP